MHWVLAPILGYCQTLGKEIFSLTLTILLLRLLWNVLVSSIYVRPLPIPGPVQSIQHSSTMLCNYVN